MKYFSKILIIFIILCMLASCDFVSFLPSITTGTTTTATTTTNSTTTTTTTTTTQKDDTFIDPDEDEGPTTDPYVNMSEAEFYANYKPATTYKDAYYRTLHYFMSGSIEEQDQEPTLSEHRPMENGLYIRNTSALYSEDGNTYYVIDAEGNIVNRIFKGAAYVTLEEVAAYVFAFGDVPANYSESKRTKPYNSPWGEYLRVNHTEFSGSTTKYPYEPKLPDISGCGGSLRYYEIDIGTTGTDCDPRYPAVIYNNGSRIERGAARIVYSRYDRNGDEIIDLDEKYLFYTYNHYNDFQEYLNYEGGWGEMFGNITGGGTISSKNDYNPTPYVAVIRKNLYKGDTLVASEEYIIELAYVHFNSKFYFNSALCA